MGDHVLGSALLTAEICTIITDRMLGLTLGKLLVISLSGTNKGRR